MLKTLTNTRSSLFWMVFHIILGMASIISPFPVIFWFYMVGITTISKLLKKSEEGFSTIVMLLSYLVSFELLGRMSGASPFIPYEVGKYLFFIMMLFGISKGYRNGKYGWIMLILILPGILFDNSGQTVFKDIVFNLLGPVNVALAIIFFKNQSITREEFKSVLRLLLFPLISVLAFVIIKTPDFKDVEFSLGANYEVSGGWGTNQVSTVLGLGAFITFLFWREKWHLSGFKWIDILLFLLFTFRGLLTFSRGGMIGGALGILILLLFEVTGQNYKIKFLMTAKKLVMILPIILILFIVFRYADNIAGGKLVLRYKGETPGTFAGHKKKTLNVFTSNRLNVFKDDLKLWKENTTLGVGVGASLHLRENTRGIAAHVELSRLLSEHGLMGLFYFLILCLIGLRVLKEVSWKTFGPILLAIFIIALFTTFHSAMRTFVSPLLIGLSLLSIDYMDEDIENPETEEKNL